MLDTGVFDTNDVIWTLCRQPNGADTNDANTDWKVCKGGRSVGAVNKP
jgi:hypothetical protein